MLPDVETRVDPLLEVGGYRVVRTLSTGRHALRVLVHADGASWVARVFARDCPDAVIDHEIAVSDAVRSTSGALRHHVSVVHDLCTTDDGRLALIEEHLAGPRLDVVLRGRHADLTLGEAVTLLAPLAAAVEESHGLGLTGLLLGPDAVRLRASGAPVLTRRSTAQLGPSVPDRFRDREPRYSLDRDALERLGSAVAASIGGDEGAALQSVMRWRGAGLDHALFDLASPLPVRIDLESPTHHHATLSEPAVVSPPTSPAPPVSEPVDSSSPLDEVRRGITTTLTALGLPRSIVSAVHAALESAGRRLERLTAAVRGAPRVSSRTVRPRFALAGTAGAVALVVAIMIGSQGAPPDDGTPSESAHADDLVGPGAAGERPVDAGPADAAGLAETELHPQPGTWPDLVDELVGRWIDCSARARDRREGQGPDAPTSAGSRSVADSVAACSASVAHEGSTASGLVAVDDPRHELLREWSELGGDVVVVERMGAAVLIDLMVEETATASLLVVRSEAGWRIRDVIAAPA